MNNIPTFEDFVNEGKSFEFTFNYNTDEDDVEYIQNILMNSGADAIAEPGLDSEEMVVKAKNAVELRKAKKAIQADGFEINESVVNEGISELIVYPSSKADHQKIANWLPKSDWHAEEENNYFSFEVSGRKDADSTEKELDKEFAKLGADVRYELQESQTFVDESKISEIFLMANYAKSFTAFRKEFMNEFGKPKTVKELQQIEAWLQTIWNNRQVQTSEGFVNEANKFSASGFTFTIMGNQDSKGSYISFLPDGKTLDSYSKDEMANFIDSYFNNMDYFRDCMSWDEGHSAAGIVFRINASYLADSLIKEFKS